MKKKKKHSFPTTPQLYPGTPKSTFCAMNDNAYRCSTPTTSRKHDHALDNILLTNGYPENVILKTKRPRRRRHQPQQQHSNKDWLYFEILFISDRLDRKITKIFRKENIDARITHKVYTLRNALSTRRNEPECKRTNCPVAYRQFAFAETPSTRSHATDTNNSTSAVPTDTHTTG